MLADTIRNADTSIHAYVRPIPRVHEETKVGARARVRSYEMPEVPPESARGKKGEEPRCSALSHGLDNLRESLERRVHRGIGIGRKLHGG